MNIPRPLAAIVYAAPWILAILAGMWFALMRFPPSGVLMTQTLLDGKSAWIFPLLPAERVSTPGAQPDGWVGQRIHDDPVYFTARVPGPYETVDADIEFRSINQPLIEFGMIHDEAGKDLELRPLYAAQLQQAQWQSVQDGGVRGFVRTGTAPSRVRDPDARGLSIWGATSSMPVLQDPPGIETITSVSLRGSHDFFVVPTNEVRMTLTLQAANRKKGNDIVSIRVFYGTDEIQRESFDISGSRDVRMGQTTDHAIVVPQARPGVYRVSIGADDDVFIRKIVTTNAHWVVGPRLVFGDVVGYATTTMPGRVWTNSRHVVAETFHPEGLQTVHLGDREVTLKRTHTTMPLDRTDEAAGQVELVAPKGDIRFVGDGYCALTPFAFFDPAPRRMTSATDLDKERVNAVLTPYVRPTLLEGGWYRAHATFTLNPSLDRLRFVVSAPGISARGAAVDVRRVQLSYHRSAVTIADWIKIMRQELVNAWHRL